MEQIHKDLQDLITNIFRNQTLVKTRSMNGSIPVASRSGSQYDAVMHHPVSTTETEVQHLD